MKFRYRLLESLQRPFTLSSLKTNHELGRVLVEVYTKLKTGKLNDSEKVDIMELSALRKKLEDSGEEFELSSLLPEEKIRTADFLTENSPSQLRIEFYYLLALHLPASSAMEMNAGLGLSGAALLKGMSAAGNSDYKLVSFEENKELCRISEQIFRELSTPEHFQIIPGNFDYSIDRLIGLNLKFNIVYVESGNRYQPLVDYFNYLSSFHAPHSVFIVDGIRNTRESFRAWKHILTLRSSYSIDFYDFGLIIFEEGDHSKKRYRLFLK